MIRQVHIRDFKSIRNVTVDLQPVTVLVGRSGTGKSNFVQALRFLRNYLLNPGGAVQFEGGWERLVPAGVDRPDLTLDIDFRLQQNAGAYRYCLRLGLPPDQTFANHRRLLEREELLELDGAPLLHRQCDEHNRWRWVNEPRSTAKVAPGRSNAISQFPAVPEVADAYTALASGLGYYSFSSTVLSIFDPPSQRGNPMFEQLPGLRDDAQNYLTVLKAIAQDLHRPDIRRAMLAGLQRINPTVVSIDLDSLTQPDHAVVGHAVGEQIMQLRLSQESDGFRRFFAHLLALYQTPAKLFNIFEEPENAIFPGALSLLAEEFQAAASNGRGHVLMTTHSPGLLDCFDADDIRVVELDEDNAATLIGPLAPEQREAARDALLTAGELLTVDPARLDRSAAIKEASGG